MWFGSLFLELWIFNEEEKNKKNMKQVVWTWMNTRGKYKRQIWENALVRNRTKYEFELGAPLHETLRFIKSTWQCETTRTNQHANYAPRWTSTWALTEKRMQHKAYEDQNISGIGNPNKFMRIHQVHPGQEQKFSEIHQTYINRFILQHTLTIQH